MSRSFLYIKENSITDSGSMIRFYSKLSLKISIFPLEILNTYLLKLYKSVFTSILIPSVFNTPDMYSNLIIKLECS